MTDRTMAAVEVFDLADKRLKTAEAQLEQCKQLIVDFGAYLGKRGWRVRFSDHVVEPAR